jgi:hypothetical protein
VAEPGEQFRLVQQRGVLDDQRVRLADRPSLNAAAASNSAAVTTPWPPRPWNRTWNIVRAFPGSDVLRFTFLP